MSAAGLAEARRRMVQHGESEEAVLVFERSYAELEDVIATGSGGTIPESTIDPLVDVPSLEDYAPTDDAMAAALRQVAMVKLNGGLGTSMGIDRAEVRARGQRRAVLPRHHRPAGPRAARGATASTLPLVLMNCFRTRDESLRRCAGIRRPRGRRAAAGLPAERRAQAARRRPHPGRLARRPRPGVVPARPRRRLRRPARAPACSTRCWTRATATPSCPTPTTSAPPATRAIAAWLARERHARTSPRSARARSTTARAATSPSQGATAGSCCATARMVGPARTRSVRGHRRGTRSFHANNLWVDLDALDALLDRARRRPRTADHRQPQDRRPGGLVVHGGDPDRDRDGRRDRGLRGRRRSRCRAAVPSGQDDQRAAAAPLRLLRARRRVRHRRSTDPTPIRSSTSTATTSWSATSTQRFPGARRRCGRPRPARRGRRDVRRGRRLRRRRGRPGRRPPRPSRTAAGSTG